MRADRDFSYTKADGLKRIVSLGDSMTVGYEVNQDQTFSSIIEQRLISKGLNVEVLNAGVSGYGNAEELLYLERELYKYGPDLVLLSFTTNDLEDNVRSNLFRLEDGKLVEAETSYLPLGKIGDFLNRNPIASFLSERSNLFVLLKERVTSELKRTRWQKHAEVVTFTEMDNRTDDPAATYQRRLAGAILERLYSDTRRWNIPLVIQSVPAFLPFSNELVDWFPFGEFDVHRPGIHLVTAKSLLDPYRCKELMFNLRSHFHYTPAAHRIVGESLAKLTFERALAKDRMVGLEQAEPSQEILSNTACVTPR